MEYAFRDIEQKWKQYWATNKVYSVSNNSPKPKCYILDMFPYPSGAGLHVGHPLGYIASDIYARYKRLCGFNVLHPMGYDAFGLPAEQYAIETGQHPALTTEKNIARYRDQLDKIGFCYDWDREVRTSNPNYYKWTQWIFLQLFHSFFNRSTQKAMPISALQAIFQSEGNINHPSPADAALHFDAAAWQAMSTAAQREVLMGYRLAYLSYAEVWWCEALGTVLANDEVVNGVSERGGHPVEKKRMRQWFLRITEYAERLLSGLDNLDWTDAMKEMQRNWIGRSTGAELSFEIADAPGLELKIFTTRPDTIFGADFMVMAPEHDWVDEITTPQQRQAILEYKQYTKSRSERERMSEVKQVSGCFTGAYALHPLTGRKLPIWIAEYVLAGYGTGAIMAVPSGDDRDHAFAKHFNIPITNIFGNNYTGDAAYTLKSGKLHNSGFLSDVEISTALDIAIQVIEEAGKGKKKVNYKLRDAGFSRQRYWGEPFPIVYQEDIPYATNEDLADSDAAFGLLPVELPHVDKYSPGPEGQGPLANITDWVNTPHGKRETNTMPGYAGSSWYFLRYMDPHNNQCFADRKATDYWNSVDVYIGGTEHAVGHLLYSRMWTKVLCDLGHIGFDEPFKKLINQGMIQGSSRFVYRFNYNLQGDVLINNPKPIIISEQLANCILNSDINLVKESLKFIISNSKQFSEYQNRIDLFTGFSISILRVDVNLVNGFELNISAFKKWRSEYEDYEFILEDGKYICGAEVEKMSKSKYNVVNPDIIVEQYGADTFRMYEMFLGPIEMSKPWDTKGIEGVHRFIKKLWRLYADEQKGWIVNNEAANDAELRLLHKTIKKIKDDIEKFSFNTSVSQLMILVNELSTLNCHKKAILQPLAVTIAPFAPHLAEELWHQLGQAGSVMDAAFPQTEEKYLQDNSKLYPVAINGKTRTELEFALDMAQADIEQQVLADETVVKWLEGKAPKKIIYVKGKMINIVV